MPTKTLIQWILEMPLAHQQFIAKYSGSSLLTKSIPTMEQAFAYAVLTETVDNNEEVYKEFIALYNQFYHFPKPLSYQYWENENGKYNARIVSSNGRKLLHTNQGYENKQDCLDMLTRVKGNNPGTIEEVNAPKLKQFKTKTMLELKDKGLAVAVTPDNNPYEEH